MNYVPEFHTGEQCFRHTQQVCQVTSAHMAASVQKERSTDVTVLSTVASKALLGIILRCVTVKVKNYDARFVLRILEIPVL